MRCQVKNIIILELNKDDGDNLEILNNLLRVRLLKNSILYKNFGFSEDEIKVSKFLISNFLKEQSSTEVSVILKEIFKATSLSDKINKTQIIKDLVGKDYLDLTAGGLFVFEAVQVIGAENDRNIPILEILNSSVSLTSKFLLLLENGKIEKENYFEISKEPYKNSYEYLEDKFQKVKIFLEHNSTIEEIEEISKKLDLAIEERFKNSDIDIYLETILSEKQLSQKEETIFLAVLSEEYNVFNDTKSLRNIDNLVRLISFKDYERFENRSLFREGSKLVNENIFEFESSVHIINEQKSFTNEELYVSEDLLQKIEGLKEPHKKKKSKLKELVEKQEIFELIDSKKDLNSVILPEKTRETLNTIIKQLDKKVINRLVKWGIRDKKSGIDARIIFHGSAGTGKTLSAVALAKTLKKDVLHFDCSKILSMYVGESEKNVRNIFDTFRQLAKDSGTEPVLFLNEADQFLSARSTDTGSSISQMYNQMQNIFLEQIENFDGVLIATTNLLDNLDKAFSRRFNYKVEFKPPSEKERLEIWKLHIPDNADYENNFSVEKLATFKLTGGQIDLIVKNTAFQVATEDKAIFKESHFLAEIEREKNTSFEDDKVMGFLK